MKRFALTLILLAASTVRADLPLIMLDPGHTPSKPGAMSSCGVRESDYNDDTAKVVAQSLTNSHKFKVQLTRQYHQEVLPKYANLPPSTVGDREARDSLLARADIANQANARIFISIHHDGIDDDPAKGYATQAKAEDCPPGSAPLGIAMTPAFKAAHTFGFNIFVIKGDSTNAARYNDSVLLAQLIGERLKAAGLPASDYHIRPIEDCASCHPIDAVNGVWNQNLAVLKATTMPAILIETENITDPEFERIAADPKFNPMIATAVRGGLEEFCGQRPTVCHPGASEGQIQR